MMKFFFSAGSVDVKNESDQKIKWLLTSCGAPQKTSGKSKYLTEIGDYFAANLKIEIKICRFG